MNDDNKRKLYDALSKDYDMGTFEQFSQDVQDENKRKKLYNAIKGEYDLPDFDGFTRQLGVVSPKQQSTTTSPAQQQQKPQQKQPQQKKWTPSPAAIVRANQFVDGINRQVKQGQQRMQNMRKYTQQRLAHPLGGQPSFQIGVQGKNKPTMFDSKNVVDGGIEYNPQTGKMEQTYLTQAGNNNIAGNNNVVGSVTIGDAAILQERVTMLEKLLEEKERTIKILMER